MQWDVKRHNTVVEVVTRKCYLTSAIQKGSYFVIDEHYSDLKAAIYVFIQTWVVLNFKTPDNQV